MEGPLGEKRVTAVPGIGPVAAEEMERRGITTASQLLEMYLQDPSTFETTLRDDYGVCANYARDAYFTLRDVSRINYIPDILPR